MSGFFVGVKLKKHACTRQPNYMMCSCLMIAGWKMENVPSVVCLMAGFLGSNHTAGVPGWSRQHPSAGHCKKKDLQFFNLPPHHHFALLSLQHNIQTRVHQHYAYKIQEPGKSLAVGLQLMTVRYLLIHLLTIDLS